MKVFVLVSALIVWSGAFGDDNSGGNDHERDPNPLDQGNDNCPATVIASLPFTDTGTTAGRADNFSFCGGSPSPDVVYEFTTTVTGNYTVSLCGSAYNTLLALNTGGACPGNTQIYCASDGCGLQSELTTLLSGGLTYYIIVDGEFSAGSYVLNVSLEASCDTCEADSCPATIIPGLPYTDTGTTLGRENDWVSGCTGANTPDVIYLLSVPSNGPIVVSLSGTSFLATLDVRTGGNCPGSSYVVCDRGDNIAPAALTFQATAFISYYIIVDNVNTDTYVLNVAEACSVASFQYGNVGECIETPGPNHQTNDCNGGCWNDIWGGNPTYQNLVSGQTFCGRMFTYQGSQILSDTDWLTFSIAESCTVRVTVNAQFQWTGYIKAAGCPVESWDFSYGPPCTPTIWAVQNVNADVFPPGDYVLEFQYGAANPTNVIPVPLDYRVTLECIPNQLPCIEPCGPFDYIECTPEIPGYYNCNDGCDGGQFPDFNFEEIVEGQTVCGSSFTYLGPGGQNAKDHDWYLFDLADTRVVKIHFQAVFPINIELLQIYDPLTCNYSVRGNKVAPACSLATFATIQSPGQYSVVVGTAQLTGVPNPRPYTFTLEFAPPDTAGDNCDDIVVIDSLPYNDTSYTLGFLDDYNPECDAGFGSPDRFYSLVAPRSENIRVSLCESPLDFDCVLIVRAGGACPGSTLIECNNDFCGFQSQVMFSATAGTTYYIIVDGYSHSEGFYTLVVEAACAAPDSLVINVETPSLDRRLNFHAPQDGTYQIWTTANKNAIYPLNFVLLAELDIPAGPATFVDTSPVQDYSRYVVVQSCPDE